MKKIVCILMALVLVMGFSACQNNTLSSQESSSQENSIPEQYINAISDFRNNLKDPNSMIIFGDIVVVNVSDPNSIDTVISLEFNAKNSYGGYAGKEFVEIFLSNVDGPLYIGKDNVEELGISKDEYVTFKQTYYKYLEESNTEMLEDFEVYDGEEVAKILGVEYYES